jgi:benzoyl-CoA reductase/2-hydroxyglutaryl-CoA dehydratase subunit BcrC/BadD/HgdB
MSGFVPEQICDITRFQGYAGERNITHYCGYANDFISQVMQDNTLDGAVFPKSCDSSRIICSYLEDTDKFIYQFHVPSRTDEDAVKFFADIIKDYKKSLEEYFREPIEGIDDRVQKINERNLVIADSYRRLEEISYGDYLREIHKELARPLMDHEFKVHASKKKDIRHRVYLIGSFLANETVVDTIENMGLAIVGDNLPESGRVQGRQTVISDDIYNSIAEEIIGRRLSPTQDNFNRVISEDLEEIKKTGSEAVIFVTQKYCEPYDYLYSVYKKKLDSEGVPSLRIALNDSEDERKVSLAVEAFADMI